MFCVCCWHLIRTSRKKSLIIFPVQSRLKKKQKKHLFLNCKQKNMQNINTKTENLMPKNVTLFILNRFFYSVQEMLRGNFSRF